MVAARVLKPKIENGDLMAANGDPKTEKGPQRDPGLQMGTHVGAVLKWTQTIWKGGPEGDTILSKKGTKRERKKKEDPKFFFFFKSFTSVTNSSSVT